MPPPEPIVESLEGELSFLLRSAGPRDWLRVRWREAEFPSLANMTVALEAHRRAAASEAGRYGFVRVANNMAAAYICSDELDAALDVLLQAEQALVGMIHDAPAPESKLAVSFAVVKYNASVLVQLAGGPENIETAQKHRGYASQALAQVVEGSDNHSARFVAAALAGLGD